MLSHRSWFDIQSVFPKGSSPTTGAWHTHTVGTMLRDKAHSTRPGLVQESWTSELFMWGTSWAHDHTGGRHRRHLQFSSTAEFMNLLKNGEILRRWHHRWCKASEALWRRHCFFSQRLGKVWMDQNSEYLQYIAASMHIWGKIHLHFYVWINGRIME